MFSGSIERDKWHEMSKRKTDSFLVMFCHANVISIFYSINMQYFRCFDGQKIKLQAYIVEFTMRINSVSTKMYSMHVSTC